MPEPKAQSSQAENAEPNYIGLVQFLVQPFLESPESLSVDCEQYNHNQRVWIRLALEGEDKGRVFGRGGRNLQAIRTVIKTAARTAGQSVYLDIYGSDESTHNRNDGYSRREDGRRHISRRSASSKPSVRPRSH